MLDGNMSDTDIQTLKKNMSKIRSYILKSYDFGPKELDDIKQNYDSYKGQYSDIKDFLRRPDSSGRECLLADIYEATELESLIRVNNFLSFEIKNPDEELIKTMNILGIIKVA